MTEQEELSSWRWTYKEWEPSQWGKRGSDDSSPGGQQDSWLVTWPLDLRGCRVSRDCILILQEGMSQGTFDDIFKSNHCMGVNTFAKQVPGKCVTCWKVNKTMRRKSLDGRASGMRSFQSIQVDVTKGEEAENELAIEDRPSEGREHPPSVVLAGRVTGIS